MNSLQWRHNGHNDVSNHQPHHCLLNRLFRHRSKKTSKLRVTGLCAGNPPGTGEFPAQMASNAENVSTWWCHHVGNTVSYKQLCFSGLNSSPPSAAYMRHWIGSELVQIMACCLFSTKPLSKSMLSCCQLDPQEQPSMRFYSNYKKKLSSKMRLKI